MSVGHITVGHADESFLPVRDPQLQFRSMTFVLNSASAVGTVESKKTLSA
jgi:hypothetical protein